MREIILDTETTGLDPASGHRLVEIGCIELINAIPTGNTFHKYLDPQRDMPEEAERIHGLSAEFLKGKPLFRDIVADFIAFIANARLVIHNAEFDMRFINAELVKAGHPIIGVDRVLDTLLLARRKHPGMSNSLDALCQRYHIDNSRRTKHGALLDSEILAEVYIELTGGHQKAFALAQVARRSIQHSNELLSKRSSEPPRYLSSVEVLSHGRIVDELGAKGLWQLYVRQSEKDPLKPS